MLCDTISGPIVMKAKRCRDCKKMIDPKTKDAIIQAGYLLATCRVCKRKEANKYAAEKRKLMKEYRSFWNED